MILTDGIHLISDSSIGELHEFARRIGLKREWFQEHFHPHYDLTTKRMSEKAVKAGAKEVDTKQLIRTERNRCKKIDTENMILRYLLWLRHGCSPHALYGDDGEMQCGSCMIDFKRDSARRINEQFAIMGMKKLKKEMAERQLEKKKNE